jgi:hypothetical protein
MNHSTRLVGIVFIPLTVLAMLGGASADLAAQESEPYEPRSPSEARFRSVLGMAVPFAAAYGLDKAGFGDRNTEGGEFAIGALVVGGIVLGPVLGYVYAGETGRGLRQAGLRAVVVGATAGTAVAICARRDCNVLGSSGPELAVAGLVALAGAAFTTFLVVRDIIEVGDRVQARNQRLGAVSVQPTYFPESGTAGLLVTWRR